MPRKKRRKRLTPGHLYRDVDISQVRADVSLGADQQDSDEPTVGATVSVEIKGKLDEPIRGVTDVEIYISPSDAPKAGTKPSPWIGLIHGIKPVIRASFFVPQREFDRVWALALSGLLKHAHMLLTPPRYQTAHVIHLFLSTHPEE